MRHQLLPCYGVLVVLFLTATEIFGTHAFFVDTTSSSPPCDAAKFHDNQHKRCGGGKKHLIPTVRSYAKSGKHDTDEESYTNTNQVNNRSNQRTNIAAPLYITIGPPCCGKTEALRATFLNEGYDPDDVYEGNDVSLQDVLDDTCYHTIPIAAFLFPNTRLPAEIGEQLLHPATSSVTIKERLLDPSTTDDKTQMTDAEMRTIILRLAGRMTSEDFADQIRTMAENAGDTLDFFRERRKEAAEDLIEAVEQVAVQAVSEVIAMQLLTSSQSAMSPTSSADGNTLTEDELPHDEETTSDGNEDDEASDNSTLSLNRTATQSAHLLSARALLKTPTVDLFVPQALFCGGISHAQQTLEQLLRTRDRRQPVSWGNTNTRPSEYAAALRLAERFGRPVQFVVIQCSQDSETLPESDESNPSNRPLTRQELFRRNVARFRNTGRYIPSGAITAAAGRVDTLIENAERVVLEQMERYERLSLISGWQEGHQRNIALCHLAGFLMDENGYVLRIGEPEQLFWKAKIQKEQRPRSYSKKQRKGKN